MQAEITAGLSLLLKASSIAKSKACLEEPFSLSLTSLYSIPSSTDKYLLKSLSVNILYLIILNNKSSFTFNNLSP